MKLKTRDIILAALFTAMTVVGAKINLLLPEIPFTFQPIMVMLSGSLIGSKAALLSQVTYLIMGLIGIPVFAKPIAGPAYIVQPSFGYILGFIAASYVIGKIIEKSRKKNIPVFILSNMAGLAVIYSIGVLYIFALMNLFLGKSISLIKAIMIGFVPFILKDIALGIVVALLSYTIYNRMKSQIKS